ncbi:sensor histidine kinase [Bifidobacterium panos]
MSQSSKPKTGQPVDAQAPAPAAPQSLGSPAMRKKKPSIWHRFTHFFINRLDRISLSAKLVACTLVVLIVGTVGISAAIRQMVGNYLLQKTDNELISQRTLVMRNIDVLRKADKQTNGLSSYFLQIRYAENGELTGEVATPLYPVLDGNVVSMPKLPPDDQIYDSMLGKPYTTSAVVRMATTHDLSSDSDGDDATSSETVGGNVSYKTMQTASAPWRVAAFNWVDESDKTNQRKGVVFIGLSLSDQIDTINTLTRYCIIVGIAIVLLGGSLAALIIQRTLDPLKRIEKTAAKIAAGDLSQRVPPAPENTEVGSLSASLNTMLARIEHSFHEQEQTTAKMKRFVSDASHELRTPLAAIHGYAELYTMQRDLPGALERADESIAHIERSSQRMTVLVEDLLSLARLDEGRGIDLTQSVSLTALVTDAVDDLHALDPDRTVRLGTVAFAPSGEQPAALNIVDGDMPPVTLMGDALRLRQVVTNIVGNIHRYTPPDSPVCVAVGVLPASVRPAELAALPSMDDSMRRFLDAVEVGQSVHAGTNYAVLCFEDHGPGVPAQSRSQLFERFYTADPSRARDKGGTGLGLAIAQSVVKAHQGLICASDTPDGGLTITIMLPIGPVESLSDAPDETRDEGDKSKPKASKGKWLAR